jgi:hypothetical protein
VNFPKSQQKKESVRVVVVPMTCGANSQSAQRDYVMDAANTSQTVMEWFT